VLGLVATNLVRRKARTVATAAGIALGVATIVALLSVGSSLKRTAAGLVHLGDADIGIFQAGVEDPTASLLPTSLATRLERRRDVREATPLLLVVEGVRADPAAIVFGAEPDREDVVAAQQVEEALAVGVDEVGPVARDPAAVEPERPDDAPELGVEMAVVESHLLPRALREELGDRRWGAHGPRVSRTPVSPSP
jgi:MacB-like periplasmic core domain